MKPRRKPKPSIPQPEENTLIQLLHKSDRLLERELKDFRNEEKAIYNRDIRSRSGRGPSNSLASSIKTQEFNMTLESLPRIQSPNAFPPIVTDLKPNSLNDHPHMVAFTPKLFTRPKSASRNSVLGKTGVNYLANSYSSYQRMANQYSMRRPYVSPSEDANHEAFSPSSNFCPNNRPRPATASSSSSSRYYLQISSQLSSENIRVVPSMSIQTLLEDQKLTSLDSNAPQSNKADVVLDVMEQPIASTHHPPSPLDKKSQKRPKSKLSSMRLPVQKVNIQVHPSQNIPLYDAMPISARSVQEKGYDDIAMVNALLCTEVNSGVDSPNAIVLHSPMQKVVPNGSFNHFSDSPSTVVSTRPVSSKSILRRYQNLNVPQGNEQVVTDGLSFDNSELV